MSTMAPMIDRDLRVLPKAELHTHLQGAMRLATFTDLAADAGRIVADPRAFTTFAEFQGSFQASFELTVSDPKNLSRLVREVVADAAADGVVWVQPHFDPHPYEKLGPPEHVMEMVLDEGRAAASDLGVGFGVTFSAGRHLDPSAVVDLAHFAARYVGQGVHSFGLAGNEAAYPPEPFSEAFAVARDAGLTSAPHAGELCGPDGVRAAVDVLGATRIAHGIRAVEDPTLLAHLVDRGVSLDVCLTSNHRLGVVPSLSRHPLPVLLAAGVRCSLGADDPLLFGVGLLDEYQVEGTELGLTDHELAALARTSIETSDAPASLIVAGTAGIDDWLRELAQTATA